MKHIFLYTLAGVLAGSLTFCKNKPVSAASNELPASRTDSLVGFTGCERAGFQAFSATEYQFTYQHVIVKIKNNGSEGHEIDVIPVDSLGKSMRVMDEGPLYFQGLVRNHIVLSSNAKDPGSEAAPGVHNLILYDVSRPAKVYQTEYCGTLEATGTGNIRFFSPTDEKDVAKKPECPRQKEWEAKGWKVGYGQICLYSLVHRSLTRKSEWVCVPVE